MDYTFTFDELIDFIYRLGVSYKESEQIKFACEKHNLNFEDVQKALYTEQHRDELADNYDTWNDRELRMF